MTFLRKNGWLLALVLVFVLLDLAVGLLFQPYIVSSGQFVCNDFELTQRAHPEKVWDRVFFGNSVVISAYREELSESGYVNLGLDYGVVRDLWKMVRRGDIHIGSELVIGLSDLTLYDTFETNPTYPWNRGLLEPYTYFQRDRLRIYVESFLRRSGREDHSGQQKSHYSGSLSTDELNEKLAASRYVNLPIEDFQENLRCLGKLADYCAKNGIRMRCVWMPVNPEVAISAETRAVCEQAKAVCAAKQVEFFDLERALDVPCFYDIGHLNYEYGAYRFMEVIDPWLAS